MAGITTANLFSVETINQLVVDPVFQQSHVLPYLKRLQTSMSTMYLPQVGGGTANWYPELTPITDSGVVAAELPVVPKKVAAIQSVSTESAMDANAAALLGQALTDSVIKAVDAAFANGGGTDGPDGLPGLTGTSTVVGDSKTLAVYVDAISEIQTAGGTATVIFISPDDWAALQKLPASGASNVPALSPLLGATNAIVPALYGVPVSVLAALTPGTAWVVDGTRTVAVERTPATLAANDGPLFSSDGVMVRCTMRLEFASVYPATVCRISAT